MKLYNYVVPSISSKLTEGHIEAEKLFDIIKDHTGAEAYHSLFDVEKREDYKAYQGVSSPAMGWMAFDFDSLDLNEARLHAIKLVESLKLQQAWFFFSGSKGFHVYVAASFFNIAVNEHTAKNYQNLAARFKKEFAIDTLDVSIVQPTRKFRLPGSLHPKTKLYKTQIGWTELNTLSIEEIKEKAKTRQPIYFELVDEDHSYQAPQEVQTAITPSDSIPSFGHENTLEDDKADGAVFKEYKTKVCISRLWQAKLQEGERHEVASILISDLHHTGVSIDDAITKIFNWANENNVAERFDSEFARMIKEQYSGERNYSYGCYHHVKMAHCSGVCGLYPKLSKEKRAKVSDIPEDLVKAEKEVDQKADKRKKDNQRKLQEKKSQNFVKDFNDWGRDGPKCTLQNVRILLHSLGISVRYDVIKKDLQINIPKSEFIIDTAKNDKLNTIISYAVKCDLPYSLVPAFVATIASQNPYNPVAEWIDASPWDGVKRLPLFFDTIQGAHDHDPEQKTFKELLIQKWMLSAIAGAYRPNGVSAGGVLVFTGSQGIGKTNWFKNLVPKDLGVLKDGMLLDPKDKDSVYKSVSNWLVELGELDATFKKADIAQLKSFLTLDEDTMRLPYQREPATFARRTVFFGSVNDPTYLNDPTGNRRFWTIECSGINHTHGLPMQQVWAEVRSLYKELGDGCWYLTAEEDAYLKAHNEQHSAEEPLEFMLGEKFDFQPAKDLKDLTFLNSVEVARSIGIDRPTKRDINAVTATLRKLGASYTKNAIRQGRRTRGFWLNPLPETQMFLKANFPETLNRTQF